MRTESALEFRSCGKSACARMNWIIDPAQADRGVASIAVVDGMAWSAGE